MHAPNVNPYVAIRALLTMMSPTDVVTLKLHDARSSAALLSGFFFGVGEAEAAVSGLMVAGCLSLALAGLLSHRRGGWRHRGRSSPGVQSVVLREQNPPPQQQQEVGVNSSDKDNKSRGGNRGGEAEKRISASPPPDRSCSCSSRVCVVCLPARFPLSGRPAIYTQPTALLWVFLTTTWSSRQIYY